MKRLFMVGLLVALIVPSVSFAKDLKVAYVDLQKALNECMAGKEAKETLEKEKAQKQKEIEKKEKQIDALKAEIEAKKAVLSQEALQKKQDDLDRLLRELKRFVQDANDELQKKQQQYTNKILSELVSVVNEIGKQRGYTIIFERVPGVLLYVDESLDITDEVIKLYDQKYQKEKEK
ncbi:MAG: OmpH family outer membrane protein [Nitrospirae bacterium]|nr:MAG: OmpH family outer membrane protein [Nitrospirota bacterium]